MNAPLALDTLKQQGGAVAMAPDLSISMFSLKGFELAQRIAKAYMSADALPAAFREYTLKKGGRDAPDQWIKNPSAMGNCLIAIETAQAVGMSITAVMQNANVIEGRLSWSAQFWIGAINSSRRFHPLRFDMQSRGPIKAKYREKLGWNKAKGGFDFEDRTVEVDDHVCIAWTLPFDCPFPKGIYTLKQARDAGLPVIESSPVSMKLSVEEGWYSKPGSKWQTEMRFQMLQYRSGTFFGRIHAPDIVMGMGRTVEEHQDMPQTFDVAADGSVTQVPISELRPRRAEEAPLAEEVRTVAETEAAQDAPAAQQQDHQQDQQHAFDGDSYAGQIERAADVDTVNRLVREIPQEVSDDLRDVLMGVADRRIAALVDGQQQQQAEQQPAATGRRRSNVASPE